MMKTPKIIILSLMLVCCYLYKPESALAQEHLEKRHQHHLAVMLGHTHVPKGFQSATASKAIIIPSWGLNYDFRLGEKWSIGLHNDMEIATYIITKDNGDELERERPIIVSVMGGFNPWKSLILEAGVGREFEKHENFWVYRFGIGYDVHIAGDWDLIGGFVVDLKENLYDAWSLSLGIGKSF